MKKILVKMRWMFLGGLISTVVVVLSGCTVSTPFSGPGYEPGKGVVVGEDTTVTVSITYAKLGEDRQKNAVFWDYVNRVDKSLSAQTGFIGGTLRKELFGDRAWTMTVWEDEESLRSFSRSRIHRRAIKKGNSAMTGSRFARVTLHRSLVPLSWEQALKYLEEEGVEGY